MLKYSLGQFLKKIKITTTIIYSQKNVPINQLKGNDKRCFDSTVMLRFAKTNAARILEM